MMRLIWNTNDQSIASLLEVYAQNADKILIAVAFLSSSGWALTKNWLQDSLGRGCQIELFVGTDFYQTDPSALQAAEALLRDRNGCALWMCRPRSNSVFHPKLYVFNSADEVFVVVGSANLTSGGLRDNREVCCSFSISATSAMASQLEALFASYRSDKDIAQPTILDIARYEGEWTRFRRRVSEAERKAAREIKDLPSIHEELFQQYLNEYLAHESKVQDYPYRTNRYKQIPALLDRLATVNSRAEFLRLYEQLVGKQGQRGLWYSGGLFRNKNQVADGFIEVCKMIREIRDHSDVSSTALFEIGLPYVKRVSHLGVNVLTEIMHSYHPNRCPVLNNNSLGSLRCLAIGRFPDPQSFDAEDYHRFTEIVTYLRDLCGFNSLGQVDHFLDYVYHNHVKPGLKGGSSK